MTNPFSGIISKELKNTFNNAIDSLLENNALSLPCKIFFDNQITTTYCNNCIFDPISLLSSNVYNGTGPASFPEGGVCPVCVGQGTLKGSSSSETIYLAFIFDSKYFLNINSKVVNIPDGSIQSLCNINLLSKIKNASEIAFDNNLSNIGHFKYERASDPEPLGFGDNRYILTLWKKK
jgi:hypothetical protein